LAASEPTTEPAYRLLATRIAPGAYPDALAEATAQLGAVAAGVVGLGPGAATPTPGELQPAEPVELVEEAVGVVLAATGMGTRGEGGPCLVEVPGQRALRRPGVPASRPTGSPLTLA
jgi:hypothetical protein